MSIALPFSLSRLSCCAVLATGLAGIPTVVIAVPAESPALATPPSTRSAAPATRGVGNKSTTKPAAPKSVGKKKSKPRASKGDPVFASANWQDGYRAAYELIYRQSDYAQGIARLRALKRDDNPDVANLIGFASRKLGRYDDAKHWYEKALAADQRHARTLSYYGMWHAEQGNFVLAAEYLEKVRASCGDTQCREYAELKGVIAGTQTY